MTGLFGPRKALLLNIASLIKNSGGGEGIGSGNFVNIASRVDWPTAKLSISASQPGVATKVAFWNGRKPMKNIRIIYANVYLLQTTTTAGSEQVDLDTLKIASTFQKDGEGIVPVSFSGSSSPLSIPAGSMVISDVIPGLEIAADGKFFVHTARWGDAGQNVPNASYYMNSTRGEGYGAATVESQVYEYINGTRAYTGSTGFNGYGPVGIIGQAVDGSNTECVIAFHDSIGFGSTEALADGDAKGNRGFIGRAFGDAGYYLWKTGRTGATIAGFRKALAPIRFNLLKDYGTSVLYQLGENSLTIGTIATEYNAAIDEIKAEKNVKVIGTTVGPKTSSTDNWATLENQTAAAADLPGSTRFNFRAHVVSQVGTRLQSVADFHAAVKSPSDPSKWHSVGEGAPARYAGDFIHPTVDGHIAAKTSVASRISAGDFNYT